MLGARTRTLLLAGATFGLMVVLAPRSSLPTEPSEPEETADRGAELGPLPEYEPDSTPLPPGAVCRIRNVAFQHPAPVVGFCISSDGASVYTVAGNATFAWDLNTGQLRWCSRGVPEKEVEPIDRGWPIHRAGSVVRVLSRKAEADEPVAELDAGNGRLLAHSSAPLPGQGVRFPNRNVSRYVWHSRHPSNYNGPRVGEIRDVTGRAPPVVLDTTYPKPDLFSLDGRYLIDGRQELLWLFSTETGKRVRSLRVPEPWRCFEPHAFTPDGRELFGWAGAVVAVNLETATWRAISEPVFIYGGNCIRFDPTGRTFAVHNDLNWELRDAATGRLRHVLDTQRYGNGEFTPDGKRFVAVYGDRLTVFDVATGRPVGAPIWPFQLRWTKDGRLLTLSGPSVASWDPLTGRRVGTKSAPHDFNRSYKAPYHTDLSADGTRLAYPTTRGTVAVLDLATGARSEVPTRHEETPQSRFSPDGRKLFVATADGVHTTDPETGSDVLVQPEDLKHNAWGELLDVSPDGRFITTRRRGLLSVETQRPVLLHGRNRLNGQWAHFTPDGRHLVGTVAVYADDEEQDRRLGEIAPFKCDGLPSEMRLAVWEVPSGKQVGLFRSNCHSWTFPVMLPDGRSLAYIDPDANVVVTELVTGRERCRFRSDGWAKPSPEYATGAALAASADGRYLASSIAGSVLVWDVRGGRSRPAAEPGADELERAWNALLREDSVAAFAAVRLLAASPKQALPFLRQKLAPGTAPDPAHVAGLIDNLRDEDFATRERAGVALESLGRHAERAMRAAVVTDESPETVRRLSELLARLRRRTTQEIPRVVRAVEAVEWIGTPQAHELLTSWAGGASGDRLAEEAKRALARLTAP
jgi:WD40 repeat protein